MHVGIVGTYVCNSSFANETVQWARVFGLNSVRHQVFLHEEWLACSREDGR